mmetsp:Transcript_10557/g.26640  ORF Transcript_10557/g.26640 Transcript_10557/m.26640 type:complete len:131 (+) Transcript_10557:258-650(+)
MFRGVRTNASPEQHSSTICVGLKLCTFEKNLVEKYVLRNGTTVDKKGFARFLMAQNQLPDVQPIGIQLYRQYKDEQPLSVQGCKRKNTVKGNRTPDLHSQLDHLCIRMWCLLVVLLKARQQRRVFRTAAA